MDIAVPEADYSATAKLCQLIAAGMPSMRALALSQNAAWNAL
jgi:hypothetical protein